ncbi:unnamed protein product [Zymoseptoria tritici ST99CH_1E4]|uniref:beta-glucosidase n=1 Tax=Zymoseptoria tritici ST99CH_1E4 TaxID=1276532 RepID=A0A2H1GAD2_ZYMTR|nr:unnamed protein product [Zymoseptoria tritici ST99CH_1E4]
MGGEWVYCAGQKRGRPIVTLIRSRRMVSDGVWQMDERNRFPDPKDDDDNVNMKSPTLILLQAGALLLQVPSVDAIAYTNVSEIPLYGQSPPVYPTPQGTGGPSSAGRNSYASALALVNQLTLEEKVNLTRGHVGTCVGNTPAVPRLGIRSLCFSDAPSGIRGQEFVSSFPAQLTVGATFDKELMLAYGEALGEEYHGKGINIALLPVAGPLGRTARGGRNWEGFGADHYLSGVGMGLVTRGLQSKGVIAQMKHWLLNEQEWRRLPREDLGESVSTNADDRTIWEGYVWPFMDALREGCGSAMCSYQRINNSYGCQNSKLLNGILKTDLGFQGFVTSDWNAQHAGVASANAGLDLVMPDGGYWGDNLTEAVTNGSVSSTRLDDMVTRILATWYHFNQDDVAAFPDPSVFNYDTQHPIVDVRGDHAAVIREIAAAGTVLVKNVDKALPLKAPRFLNIYGYDATIPTAPWNTSARFGGGYDVNFGWNTFDGTLITAGGSGSNTPSGLVSPFEAIQRRVQADRGTTRWDFVNVQPTVYASADASIVFINAYASESFDRTTLADEWSDQLVNNVAAKHNNTIVVIHSAGIRLVDRWIEHPNVTAVVFALLPGEQSGNSIVDVLYGDVVPSGRLPFTVAKKEEDYGNLLNSSGTALPDPFPQIDFTEGLHIDYKYFDQQDLDVRFEFGYGLSYTEFEYGSAVEVVAVGDGPKDEYPSPLAPEDIPQGGSPELWEVVYNITFSIKNVGDVDAAEVPQLYLAVPNAPKWQLRGFEKTLLRCGEEKQVTLGLTRRDLSVWDVVAQKWRMQKGTYGLFVGASSRDKRIEGGFVVE